MHTADYIGGFHIGHSRRTKEQFLGFHLGIQSIAFPYSGLPRIVLLFNGIHEKYTKLVIHNPHRIYKPQTPHSMVGNIRIGERESVEYHRILHLSSI